MRPPPARVGPFQLFWLHLKVGALNEMQYRANFLVQLGNSAVALATGLVAIALVYSHVESLAGWSRPELLAVMGVHILIGGFLRAFVLPNMIRLMEGIEQGTLDYALVRPADSQLLVSVREFSLWSLVDVLTGLGVIVWSITQIGADVGLVHAAGFVLVVVCGMAILYCVWISITTITFKVVRFDPMIKMLDGIYQAGRWPVTIYPGWLRAGLTVIVPLAFAVTVPAETISARIEPVWFVWTLVATVVAAVVTRLIWRWGIRSYSGASA